MELNVLLTSLIVFTQFVISFPVGFLILSDKIKFVPFIIKLPIYISLGFIIITILLFAIGTVTVNHYFLIAIGIISYFLLFYKLLKSKHEIHLNFSKKFLHKNYVSVISLVFFILVFFYFTSVTGFMGWPPKGDIVNHGLIISLIEYNGKIDGSLAPLWSEVAVRAPQGLHVFAANNSSLFEIFPGESIFLIGASIMILIVLTVFSTVYILTRSIAFSSVAMAATFYIHPSGNLERWVLGFFYNGPYPNMYAFLILFIFIIFWFILPNSERKDKKFLIMILSTIVGFLIVYPPFVILPVLFILVELIIKHFNHRNFNKKDNQTKQTSKLKKNFVKTNYFNWTAIILPVISFDILILKQIEENLQAVKGLSSTYLMHFEEYFMDYTYILVLITLIFSCIFILKRKYLRLSIFYFAFTSILIFSSQEIIFDKIWFLLSGRLFAFLQIFSWIMVLFYAKELIDWKFKKNMVKISSFISSQNLSKLITGAISITIISILFLNPLISHATFQEAEKWGWFPLSKSFQNDYELLAWISKNIEFPDLIMIDTSHTSRFIQSFSIQNVTASIWITSEYEIERAKENQIVWSNPQLLPQFLQKYDVKYIMLDSEWGYKDILGVSGDTKYYDKKFNVKKMGMILSKFSFLDSIKKIEDASVYQVLKPELNEFLNKQAESYDFSSGIGWEKKVHPNSDKFTLLRDDDKKISLKYEENSDKAFSVIHRFSDEIDTVSLNDVKWINLSINATKPTDIELFLMDSTDAYFLYIIRIDNNKWTAGKIENITLPIVLPDHIWKTPDLSQIEKIQINIRSSYNNNLITIHELLLTS